MKVKFTIPGPPKGKGRPRFRNAGRFVQTYTPEETAAYENLVKLEYRRQCGGFRFPDEAQLDLRVMAYFPVPKSVSKKKREDMLAHRIRPTVKPDWDNVGKVVSDACNEIAYRDDKQIVDTMVRKFYSENPRVVVILQDALEVNTNG